MPRYNVYKDAGEGGVGAGDVIHRQQLKLRVNQILSVTGQILQSPVLAVGKVQTLLSSTTTLFQHTSVPLRVSLHDVRSLFF